MIDKLVLVKLVTGDEVLGRLVKEYDNGQGIILSNVMEIREDEKGMVMRSYLLSEQENLVISQHAIITYALAIDELNEVYLDSEKYWPSNAFKAFIMDKATKKRSTH